MHGVHAGCRLVAPMLIGASSLLATAAHASNGTDPRIPVDWTGSPCMTIVDRSTSTVLHLPYAIPQEDTNLGPDEVFDSRTHQFFAFTRPRTLQTTYPFWITQDDVDRATAAGAGPTTPDPEDVLETSTEWSDAFVRITADDDRRPITFAAAMAGVDWDTAGLPAGNYLVAGYTFMPAFNDWSERRGVVKVVDEPALEASGPALAVSNYEEVIFRDETVTLEGCVSAMEGSTITAYWSFDVPELEWNAFIEDEPVSGTSFAVELTPPEALAGESALIRFDIVDPQGRSFTNYMNDRVVVLGSDGPASCDDGVGFIGGAGCPGTGGDSTGVGDSTGASATDDAGGTDGTGAAPPEQDPDGPSGCGCRTDERDGPGRAGLLALGLLALARRRRRR